MSPNPPAARRPPPNAPTARVKPRLRGVSHEIAAFLSLPVVIGLIASARGKAALAGAVTYGVTLFLVFAVSAVYHRPTWTPRRRNVLGRIDQAAIFLLIAGTYTPFCLLLGHLRGRLLLGAVWTATLAGVVLALLWDKAPKRTMAAIYVTLGWFVLPILPAIHAAIHAGPFLLLMAGGVLYTVGAAVYAFRRPDPFPAVFGYHEIFHLLVVGGAACHVAVTAVAIRALG
jgi:hemolysin III